MNDYNELINQMIILLQGRFMTIPEVNNVISDFLSKNLKIDYKNIVISGIHEELAIFVCMCSGKILALSPFSDLRLCPLLLRWDSDWYNSINEPLHSYEFFEDEVLKSLLRIPKLVLINLCVIENFPIPRLNLSTGVIASYVRKYGFAEVELIDMQYGITVAEIAKKVESENPDMIGISISFGQMPVGKELLLQLFRLKNYRKLNSMIFVGNVIPNLDPYTFLNEFPEIIVCYREGEKTTAELAEVVKGMKTLEQVSGILFVNSEGKVIRTAASTMNINDVPLPALDTIYDLSKTHGALTLELSRGCDYAKCTFCPRTHKTGCWRGLSPDKCIDQIRSLISAAHKINIKKHIYFADEEFIGELPDGQDTERIIEICNGILNMEHKIKFDTSVRADSVYDCKKDEAWHIKRLKMLSLMNRAGLDRLFLGIESGCQAQLERFGKGVTPFVNLTAIRLLTALGIKIRIGFIMFDPLMNSVEDLKTNLIFLETQDALLRPADLDKYSYEELFNLILNEDESFIGEHSMNLPLYSKVSYMLTTMEVLINSPYSNIMQAKEKETGQKLLLNKELPDTNMGRFKTSFINPFIAELSDLSQRWIDSNFALMYTVKSLYKVANSKERFILYSFMESYRELSHYLLRYLISVFNERFDIKLEAFLVKNGFSNFFDGYTSYLGLKFYSAYNYLDKWQQLFKTFVDKFSFNLLKGIISDTETGQLSLTIENWHKNIGHWDLINSMDSNYTIAETAADVEKS